MSPPQRILALDLASNTGWACGSDSFLNYGEERFPADLGEMAARFEIWLKKIIEFFDPEEIVAEDTIPVYRKTTRAVLARLYGMQTILRKVCYQARKSRIPLTLVSPAEWRMHFIGRSKAPNELGSAHFRRKWLKQEVISRCKDFGWEPASDDAADALGILHWAQNRAGEKENAASSSLSASAARSGTEARLDTGAGSQSDFPKRDNERSKNRSGIRSKPISSRERLAKAA